MRLTHPMMGPLIVEKNDAVLLVSDLHLNHNKEFIWGKRASLLPENKAKQIHDVNSYTDYVINELYSAYAGYSELAERVYLISLGDTCFNDSDMATALRFSQLPFTHMYVMAGNHPSGIKQLIRNDKLPDNMTLIAENIPLQVNKQTYINLSHYPVVDFATGIYGALCGHCHGSLDALNKDSSDLGRIMDIGVENALKCKGTVYFTLDECMHLLYKKEPWDRELKLKRIVYNGNSKMV